MPYIGNTPALDYISFAVQNFTVTAGTTVYTLDYSVSNENDIALYINSVAQRPGASFAYSATGTTLTLTSATLVTDTMYAVFIGRAVQTVTPPASSVTNTMLSPSVITGQTAETSIAGGDSVLIYDDSAAALRKMTRTNFVAGVGGTNTPSFFAYKTSDQTISDSTLTKVTLTSEVYDTDSAYDTTNSKFTVPSGKAGKYLFTYGGLIGNFVDGNWCEVSISVNGTEISPSRVRYFVSTSQSAVIQGRIIYDLADSDYVEMNTLQSSGGSKTFYGTVGTYFTHFQGVKLI
jgi:hypothetical protein